ncbi:hypothetical protein D3C78_1427430 [compost metagenome]
MLALMLMAMQVSSPRSIQLRNWHRAWSITQWVSGWISSQDSASGMNSLGGIIPRSGCSQRSRASKPVTWWSLRRTLGW